MRLPSALIWAEPEGPLAPVAGGTHSVAHEHDEAGHGIKPVHLPPATELARHEVRCFALEGEAAPVPAEASTHRRCRDRRGRSPRRMTHQSGRAGTAIVEEDRDARSWPRLTCHQVLRTALVGQVTAISTERQRNRVAECGLSGCSEGVSDQVWSRLLPDRRDRRAKSVGYSSRELGPWRH
jgi:hypothetical protein